MTHTTDVFPDNESSTILQNIFDDYAGGNMIKFAEDSMLNGWVFSAELNEKAFLTAVHLRATNEDISWVLPAKTNQDYFRLIISTNYVLGGTNAYEHKINIRKGSNESLLVLLIPQSMLLRYIDDWQYHELVTLFKKTPPSIHDYEAEIRTFFQRIDCDMNRFQLSAQVLFDAFLIKLIQLTVKNIYPQNELFFFDAKIPAIWNLFRFSRKQYAW